MPVLLRSLCLQVSTSAFFKSAGYAQLPLTLVFDPKVSLTIDEVPELHRNDIDLLRT